MTTGSNPPLPQQGIYEGYVPRDLWEQWKLNEAIYISLGKPVPDHYFFYNNAQYRVSYSTPYSARLVYQGSEQTQLEQAGLTVDLNIENPAQSTVTIPTTTTTTTKTTTTKLKAGGTQSHGGDVIMAGLLAIGAFVLGKLKR